VLGSAKANVNGGTGNQPSKVGCAVRQHKLFAYPGESDLSVTQWQNGLCLSPPSAAGGRVGHFNPTALLLVWPGVVSVAVISISKE